MEASERTEGSGSGSGERTQGKKGGRRDGRARDEVAGCPLCFCAPPVLVSVVLLWPLLCAAL